MPTSRRAAPTKKPSAVRKAAPGTRTAYDFNCPLTNCTWTGSLGKVDATATDQQAADDTLVCVMLAADHLRSTHGALLPNERAAVASGPPVGGGGAP